jgi:thiol-disulfide isomerase/thioredoxin
MSSTTLNLILFATVAVALAAVGGCVREYYPAALEAFVAVALAAVGGCVLRVSRTSRSPFHALLRVVAHILIVSGYWLAGTLLWYHVSGQMGRNQVWNRAPSFYLLTAFLCASAFWWFHRWMRQGHRGVSRLGGYPVFLILLVGSSQLAVHYLEKNKHEALYGALLSAKDQVAPEIQFVDANGEPHKLSEFKGKVVLVNFWATTCGPCVQEMPGLSDLQRKFKDDGFVLVYLSSEKADVLARFFRGRSLDGVNGRLIPELPAPTFYSSGKALPISFLINRSGIVKETWLGAWPVQWTEQKIKREL